MRSTVQKALTDHSAAAAPGVGEVLSASSPAELDVEKLFIGAIESHVWAVAAARRIAEQADNDAARIGAVRTVATTSEGLVRLLALVGLVPNADEVLLLRARAKRARDAAKDEGERVLFEGNVAA